jgi:hypothetical protein
MEKKSGASACETFECHGPVAYRLVLTDAAGSVLDSVEYCESCGRESVARTELFIPAELQGKTAAEVERALVAQKRGRR